MEYRADDAMTSDHDRLGDGIHEDSRSLDGLLPISRISSALSTVARHEDGVGDLVFPALFRVEFAQVDVAGSPE